MSPASRIVFMPIKPRFVEQILRGRKRYEFRRAPIQHDISQIIIYSSYPVKKIIGVAEVGEIVSSTPTRIWEETKHLSGISRSYFREYFQGKKIAIAIHLRKVHIFQNGFNVDEIDENFHVPQSFSYVENHFLEKVIAIGDKQSLYD